MRTLGRFVFWDFPRASWQYDVMVILILAFIFATPRDIFRDQPKAATVVMLSGQAGMYWIDSSSLSGLGENEQVAKAAALIEKRFKIKNRINRVEAMKDDEQTIIGYTAFTKP
ncbi:MAG TPA: hypothetical protein VGN17_23005 [Bryobacteraceae bacterium]|jgi:hypothetical protein